MLWLFIHLSRLVFILILCRKTVDLVKPSAETFAVSWVMDKLRIVMLPAISLLNTNINNNLGTTKLANIMAK